MCEKSTYLQENTVTSTDSTLTQARDYEQKRFGRRYRMRLLDTCEKKFARQLFEMVGTDAHIVDVPCGSGRFFEIFSKASRLSMVDYSENMLKTSQERLGSRANVSFIRADISSIPLEDGCAELCFCMRLFHHMKNDTVRQNALKELARISKQYVALSFYNKNCLRFYFRKALGKKIRGNYITFNDIVSLAKKVGLKPVGKVLRANLVEQQSLVIFKKSKG